MSPEESPQSSEEPEMAAAESPRGSRTREQVLSHASDLFRERGFRGTSIGDVLARTGIQKGSLYHHFASKEELGHAVLDRWTEDMRSRLLEVLTSPFGAAPLDRIAASLDGFVAAQEASGCRGGCPFGTLAAEMADVDERFRLRLSDAFRKLSDAFAALVTKAKHDGELRPEADPRALGDFLVAAIEGGILLSKVHRSTASLSATMRAAKAHLFSFRSHVA
jgi:TetR/AcrR family transcriptional regulator, transcriptional repressor for nem operon